MPTYITLGNWTDQGIRHVKDAPKRIDAVRQLMKNAGGELKGYYLTMGAYDFVAVSDLPTDEAAAKILLTVAGQGNVRTVTLKAFDEAHTRTIMASLT